MEIIIRTQIKIILDSLQLQLNSAQCALQQIEDSDFNFKKLEIIGAKLKSINDRFILQIQNFCKSIVEPNVEEISRYTSIQIQAEELISEIDVRLKQHERSQGTGPVRVENFNITGKLPRMELAKFDGDILKWYQFWDQFASNVDNRNIDDVDKLLYLQSALEGDAQQAIAGLDTTNRNYSIAVNTLKERYAQPNTIIDAHYGALYRIKPATTNNIKETRHVLSEIEKHLRVLSSLGEDVNHNHLRAMIMEKFPEDLIYELRLKISDENDSIDNIRKNLEYIIAAREVSNRLRKEIGDTNTVDTIVASKITDENFTLGALHVKNQEINDNVQCRLTTFRKGTHKTDNKKFNKFKTFTQKRSHDFSDKTNEPPNKKDKKCIFCKRGHFNDECTTYKSVQDRKSQLGDRCFNCLGQGHRSRTCRNNRKCRHCGKYGDHNRALCPTKLAQPVRSVKTDNIHAKSNVGNTLLQTCLVLVSNPEIVSKLLPCRILLDSGSQRSYITESVANSLNLPVIERVNLSIFTFGAKSAHNIESPVVQFKITTRKGITRQLHVNVVPYITQGIRIPELNEITRLKINHDNLIMADDGSCGDRIDILIGNDYYHSFMGQERISLGEHLFLVNSDFGWIWSGRLDKVFDSKDRLTVLTYFQSNEVLDNKYSEPDLPLKYTDVKVLWDLESIGITDSPTSTHDEEAIKLFNDNILFKDNRYNVRWPWIEFPPSLPDNFGLACGRLNSLIKRLSDDEIAEYDQVIQEQLQNGIIEIVSDSNILQEHPIHYLPHHCVRSKDKPNKLRVVFDASAKVKDNHSLNECLYRGPLLLEDLTGLLLKFREHPIGIIADIEKAFLQLGLQDSDKDVTRFLWFKDIHSGLSPNNILHLRFCRVPFGVISSPFLLNATIKFHLLKSNNALLKQLAEDIYVDNLVTGATTPSDAQKLYATCKQTFDSLSMNLREWNSNSKELNSIIPNKFKANDQDTIVKVLGMMWSIDTDQLHLKLNFWNNVDSVQTKRDVLKVIASVYDPCGLAVPIMLPAKKFFQGLWKLKTKWDVTLDNNLLNEWRQIIAKFDYLKEIKIHRYFSHDLKGDLLSNEIKYELHCFTDASLEAYAAVIYLRCSLNDNNIVSFVIGKSRLVPIKDQSNLHIPRLELLGVLIGYRLINYVTKFLRLKIRTQFLWTDSQIVLNWYKSGKLLPPFVSRRINEIKQNKALQVRYVPTKLNPADVGTRTDRVDSYNTWLRGPQFLTKDTMQWPKDCISSDTSQIQTSLAGVGLTKSYSTYNANVDLERINSVTLDSELRRILEVQIEYFPKEVEGIVTDLSRTLQLFKDQNGILRCRGRFKYADLTYNQKEPILLPKNSEFTYSVITDLHQKNYHVGVSHTLALLRQNYWIPQGRAVVQRVIKKCPQCIKYGGGPFKLPAIPDLPTERVKLELPFAFTGLDYFGPLFVKEGDKEKRWVCLFTCLTIRAIHMEVVKDLSAEECLLAIRRFVATRGLPQLIMSDNATQFKLTAEVMTSDYCITNKIRWKFIPESAPWFGGFYERLIGVVKNCMKRTLDKHLLNHSQLCTIMKELEAVINTRPLTSVGAELEHVLTPIDFLRVGGSVTTQTSEQDFLESATITKTNLIDGWKRGQIILSEFVKMFSNQYLTGLRERRDKHRQPRIVVDRAPKLLETVQLKSEGSRAHWKIGKIIELVKGSDGQIRVARVKLSSGETLTRSIAHLYPIELDDDQNTVPFNINQNNVSVQSNQPVETDKGSENHQSSDLARVSGRANSEQRLPRASALKAKQMLKEWTSQLMMTLFQ